MMGKEFSEFQVDPVSGGTPESGQGIWERVWRLQLERKCFYPSRDIQLGLGLIWGCFIFGHMVQVFACRKGRGLQEVRVSTLILTSAYGSEVWSIFWREIIKHWILLENYSFLFSPLFRVSASVHFSLQNKQPQSMGCKELDMTNWLNDNNPTHIHLLQSKNEKEFWKLKWSFFTLKIFFFFFCYHLQRDLIHLKQSIAQTTIRWGFMG